MSERLRLGLLSTAKINDQIIAGAPPEVEIAAVASRDGARAQAYARERGIGRSHGSYEALLADPDVDAVYVSLPHGLHHPWTLRALAAGKHVLCEKPYSRLRPTWRRHELPRTPPASSSWRRSCTGTTRRSGGCRSSSARARSGGCARSARPSRSSSKIPATTACSPSSTVAR